MQLGAHVFSRDARIALCDFLYSPDQLPRSFCDTHALTQALGEAALAGKFATAEGREEVRRHLRSFEDRHTAAKAAWKKAVVTLSIGNKIEIFEGQ